MVRTNDRERVPTFKLMLDRRCVVILLEVVSVYLANHPPQRKFQVVKAADGAFVLLRHKNLSGAGSAGYRLAATVLSVFINPTHPSVPLFPLLGKWAVRTIAR